MYRGRITLKDKRQFPFGPTEEFNDVIHEVHDIVDENHISINDVKSLEAQGPDGKISISGGAVKRLARDLM